MLQKLIYFIKYNNATIIILAVILILGGGALAAGPENIGQKQTSVQGVDNTALLAADLENFSMDFKIENIQQDENYYYVTYSFLDLALSDSAWQYQLSQKTQKVSKKIKQDVGVYMAKFMAKHYEARIRELKQEKSLAQSQGEQKRVEVTEYSGLIGKTLDLAAAVFPGYQPVVKNELPTPEFAPLPASPVSSLAGEGNNGADNLTQIYNDYVAAHPEIFAAPQAPADTALTPNPSPVPDVTGEGGSSTGETLPSVTETPTDSTGSPPAAADSAVPETSAISEPANVNVIDLPAPAPEAPVEPTPAPTPTTDSAPAQ